MGSKTIRNVTKIFQAASGVLFGRVTAGTGRGEELTAAQARTLLDVPTNATLTSGLAGKTNTGHTHAQSDVTGLVSSLALKADLVGGVIPTAQIPALAISEYLGSVANQSAMLALVGDRGDWCVRSDLGTNFVLAADDQSLIGSWVQLSYPTAPVTSVAGRTGAVTLTVSDVSGAGATANPLSQFAATTSAQLDGVITDNTGTGPLVFGTAPSLTNLNIDRLTLSGNVSAVAWTTNGLRIKGVAATLTDTSSAGTVAAAYTDVFGGNTIAASAATTFTNYVTAFFKDPVAGANVTMSNKFALGAESIRVGTSNQFSVANNGAVTINVGSDATGDLHYRNSGGTLSRLALGSALQVLRVNAAATGLEYAAAGASSFDWGKSALSAIFGTGS